MILISCRVAEINNRDNIAVSQTADGHSNSLATVKIAIIKAGTALGWNMSDVKSGLIEGTLNIRGAQAVVSIPYSAKSYSIKYKSSKNFKYDPERHTIHANYNRRVQRLNNAIQNQLVSPR